MNSTLSAYRYTTAMLLSCSTRQLTTISNRAHLDIHNSHAVYVGLTRAQTLDAARLNRADALTILARQG